MDIGTIATGFVRPKTTALFFDKIWIPRSLSRTYLGEIMGYADIPDSVRFIEKSEEFFIKNAFTMCNCPYRSIEDEVNFLFSRGRNRAISKLIKEFETMYKLNIVAIFFDKTEFERTLLYAPDINIGDYLGFDFIDINGESLDNNEKLKKKIKKNVEHINNETKSPQNAIEVCIKLIPEIVEEKLEWKQVEEIRKDKKSFESLRRFWNWFDIEMKDKTNREVEEILETKLEEYKFALKKHGILTIIGGFTTVLSSTSTLLTAILSNKLEIISAGLAVSAGIITFTSDQIAEIFQNRREPIAYIYKLSKMDDNKKMN